MPVAFLCHLPLAQGLGSACSLLPLPIWGMQLLQKKAGSFGFYKCWSRHSSLTDLDCGFSGDSGRLPSPLGLGSL